MMNRYQKVAMILGALALFIAYEITITKIVLRAVALIGKEFLYAMHRGKTSLLFLLLYLAALLRPERFRRRYHVEDTIKCVKDS